MAEAGVAVAAGSPFGRGEQVAPSTGSERPISNTKQLDGAPHGYQNAREGTVLKCVSVRNSSSHFIL